MTALAARAPQPASELASALAQVARTIDREFDALLPVPSDPRARLYEAMRHAAIGGGKRLRPLLLIATADLFAVDRASSVRAAAAIEAIHVYSLIHDDLPAMDDDALRHGKPTLHLAYDEATAILAGDCLHALAFEILADKATHADPAIRAALIADLAHASGPAGMAGGQAMDLAAESATFDLPTVTRLQALKTGALICAAVEAGAILGQASDDRRAALRGYARDLGLAFQIADDLLDVEGDEAAAGKKLRKDGAAGKETFVSLLGIDEARARCGRLVDSAIAHLAPFGEEAALLRDVARFVVERNH